MRISDNPYVAITGLVVAVAFSFLMGMVIAPGKTITIPIDKYKPLIEEGQETDAAIPVTDNLPDQTSASEKQTDNGPTLEQKHTSSSISHPATGAAGRPQPAAFSASSFRASLSNTDPVESLNSFTSMLKVMDSSDIMQALNILKETNGGRENWYQKQLLLYKWGQIDGAAAMAYAKENDDGHSHGHGWRGHGDTSSILKGWATTEPDAAIEWARNNYEGEENPYMAGIVEGLAAHDISRAMKLTSDLPYGRVRGQAAHALVNAWMKEGLDTAISWTESIEDKKLQSGIASMVASRYARTDPAGAANWELSLKSDDEITDAAAQIASRWSHRQPQEAADWANSLNDKDSRSSAVATAVQNWTYRDPVACADWMEAQPKSPTKDTALVSFSTTLSRTNPSLALDWAGTISDEQIRSDAVGTIIKGWYKKDPKAAGEYINAQQ